MVSRCQLIALANALALHKTPHQITRVQWEKWLNLLVLLFHQIHQGTTGIANEKNKNPA